MLAPPFRVATIRRANPSYDHLPSLRARLEQEKAEARRDPDALASWRSLRLNQGTSDVQTSTLLDAGTWSRIEVEAPAERTGRYALGLDLGQSAAMSASAAFWPQTGALETLACFPELPDLRERGLADGVGRLYVEMHARGELIVAGRRVSDPGELLAEALSRWGRPAVIVADRWREAELREVLERIGFPPAELVIRGQGFQDGGQDLREFRRACAGERVRPTRSLLLRRVDGPKRGRSATRPVTGSSRRTRRAGAGQKLATTPRRRRSWPWLLDLGVPKSCPAESGGPGALSDESPTPLLPMGARQTCRPGPRRLALHGLRQSRPAGSSPPTGAAPRGRTVRPGESGEPVSGVPPGGASSRRRPTMGRAGSGA